jgi:hypothetical protein
MERPKFRGQEMFRSLGRRSRSTAEPEVNPALEAIWSGIAAIPRGQVCTY